jgi:hypothetical protein
VSTSTDPTDIAVAHPFTGELFGALDSEPPASLADVLLALRERKSQLGKMQTAVETEIRRRLAMRERTVAVWGDFEVEAKPAMERVWDADELEATLRDLYDRGAIDARDTTEVIRKEPVVQRREAQQLLGRLSGDALRAVERCFRWVPKGPARVTVTRSVQLLPPEEGS